MRLLARFSDESWQSSASSTPRCAAPLAPSSLHLRSRTRRVLFSIRKDTSCRTPSSRIISFPKYISLRLVFTRSMRPRCTVCSSCSVLRRGFSMLHTFSFGTPDSRDVEMATRALMSISASATLSSKRLGLDVISSTTAKPPARPRGFRERSSRLSTMQCLRAWHKTLQPCGPIEFAWSARLSKREALGHSSSWASRSAPTSVMRLFERSSRTKNRCAGMLNTCAKTAMSASPSREVKVVGWQPGASMENVSGPASSDSRIERTTRWFALQSAASAARRYTEARLSSLACASRGAGSAGAPPKAA
mmetsp:Transcript_52816/g.150582  ORF Transcript_52816/g.150582 Transcript_52816/m.150582 type:complete len:305 (-) Transcript_52816:241-1155(-)